MKQVIADRYQLIELIGQGGMADVYIAQDVILNRRVAIKMLRTNLAKDPIYVTRFQREASAAASLCHKNIVEIYDVGEEDNRYYIVMEYVPGVTLKELINRRGALHVVEAIDIMQQITSGASKAHQLGIVHRDLKPQNIFVTESGIAKIGDFGIASVESLAQVTKTDVIMGSLHYLAPELARGEKATVQSDIYAFGIVLYELLRGEVPFHGESPVNIALKHMQSEIPSVCAINPSIPQSVENIIIKATAKNLCNRYQTMSEMLHDLSTCMDRLHEEKLVFEYDPNIDPTIVVEPKEVFGEHTESIRGTRIEEVDEEDSPKKGNRKKLIIAGIVSAVVAVVLLLVFVFSGNKSLVMPDVSNLSKEDAIELLEENDLIVSDQFIEQPSDEVEAGNVIESDPKVGTKVEEGQEVILTISTGEEIIIGNYSDMELADAKEALEKIGFEVTVKEEASDEIKSGNVISQSIDEGTIIDPEEENREIELVVSTGKEIILDDYTGMTYQKAETELKSLGFTVIKVESESNEAKDLVIMQSAEVGTIYKEDDQLTITLTVSSGEALKVPNVIGLNYIDAREELESQGFTVNLHDLGTTDDDSILVNAVVVQDPSPLSEAEEGISVTISYYSEIKKPVDDTSGEAGDGTQ